MGLVTPLLQGQVSFFAPPSYVGSGTPFVADFNGDGYTDIFTADGIMNFGVGNGTFTQGTSVLGRTLAVADFNGDGKADLLQVGNGTLLVLLGKGDGTFQVPISSPSNASLIWVGAGDLNGDGKADVVGVFNSLLLVYLSKGDGTFALPVSYSLGFTPGSQVFFWFGDFNGDGKVDVAVVTVVYQNNSPSIQEIVFPGNGDGTLQTPKVTAGASTDLGAAIAADFNEDGKLDLVTSTTSTDPSPSVFIQLGNGDGTFQTPQMIAPVSAKLAADGLDLLLSGPVIEVYVGHGDGTFSYKYGYRSGAPYGEIAVGNFSPNASTGVVAGNLVLYGSSGGALQGWPALLLPNSVGLAVMNGAFEWISQTGSGSYAVNIAVNDGVGNLTPGNSYPLPQTQIVTGIAAGLFNGDTAVDLIVVGSVYPSGGGGFLNVLLGNGDGTFQPPVVYSFASTPSTSGSVLSDDFNKDGKWDIAVPQNDGTVAIFLGNGNGTFGSPTEFYDGGASSIVDLDVNNDGNLDIVAAGNAGLAVLLGNGDGTFQPATFLSDSPFTSVLWGSINEDNNADLVVNQGDTQVFLGNGDGTFGILPPITGGVEPVALADIDQDGIMDIVASQFIGIGQPHDGLYEGILLGNGDGTFSPFTSAFTWQTGEVFYFPRFEYVVSMNGDNLPDLVFGDNPISDVFIVPNTSTEAPRAVYSPTSVTFPGQTVGTSSDPTLVTLTNLGQRNLSFINVSITGTDSSDFSQTNNCPTDLQSKASCTIKVTFSPTAPGSADAELTVKDNSGYVNGSQFVPLTGTGIAPNIEIEPAQGSQTSATVSAGRSAIFSLMVSSTNWSGTADLSCSITPVVASGPSCTLPASVSVSAGGNGTPVTITVETTAPGIAGMPSPKTFPGGVRWASSTLGLLAVALLGRGRRRLQNVALSVIVLGLVGMTACGGSSSSSSKPTPGTPAGTYTATVSATGGGVTSKMELTVVVK